MSLVRSPRVFALLVALPLALVLGAASAQPAQSVDFQDFAPPAFQRALDEDRLVLLVLEVPWSQFSRRAELDVWTNPEVKTALDEGFVAVRARADLRPDLVRRFPAEGWPAMSVLLPDGTPLFLSVGEGARARRVTSGYRPAIELADWLRASRSYYVAQRETALELSRSGLERVRASAVPKGGEVSRQLLWRVGQQMRRTFDAQARYFGGAPRIPRFDLIELMIQLGAEDQPAWGQLGISALETLGKELVDPDTGALQRMALGADWSLPQRELLLDRNARYLDLLGLAYRATGKRAFRERGLAVARFLDERLGRDDGSFMAGICAACPGGLDTTVLSSDVALAAASLIRAGAAFGEPVLVERGLAAARFLAGERFEAGKGLARAREGDERILELNLEDLAEGTLAFLAAYEVSGERVWLDRAVATQSLVLNELRTERVDCLLDRPVRPSGPKALRVGLYPIKANTRNARALLRLHRLTGSETYRRSALGILRAYAESYERVLLHAPAFGVALYEAEFDPIEAIVVSAKNDAASVALRSAAMQAEYPHVVVRSVSDAQGLGVPEWKISSPALVARHGESVSEGAIAPERARAELARLRLIEVVGAEDADPRVNAGLPLEFERPRGFRGSSGNVNQKEDGGKEDE